MTSIRMLILPLACVLLIGRLAVAHTSPLELRNSFACAGARDGTFVRNSVSCAAYYYCHDGGRAAPDACPMQTHFNARRQRCEPLGFVDCSVCSSHGIQNLADPLDMRSYYQCVAGIRQHQTCSPGLVFDAAEGECNIEQVVTGSGRGGSAEDEFSDEFDVGWFGGGMVGNAAVASLLANQICANFARYNYVQFGDPDDCAQYYVCMRGTGYQERCTANLLFNAHTGYCDRAGTFNFCQNHGPIKLSTNVHIHVPHDAEPTQRPPQQPPSVNTHPPAVWPPQQPPPNNPQPPPVIQPPHILPPAQQPNPPHAPQPQPPANRPMPPAQPPPTNTWAGEYICATPNGNFTVPDSCTHFVQCINGQQLNPVHECDVGHYFHTLYQECTQFGQEHCYRSGFEDAACRLANGYFGVPGSCRRYVHCVEGRVSERHECAGGQFWSVPDGRCSFARPTYC